MSAFITKLNDASYMGLDVTLTCDGGITVRFRLEDESIHTLLEYVKYHKPKLFEKFRMTTEERIQREFIGETTNIKLVFEGNHRLSDESIERIPEILNGHFNGGRFTVVGE